MKTIAISFLLAFQLITLSAQNDCFDYCLNFEDSICLNRLSIDTTEGNLWQIGHPNKIILEGGYVSENAIVSDTINSYSANNHSVFTIRNTATEGDIYGFKTFTGSFFVQTDTLNDFAQIEFSPDGGNSWIDLLKDTVYSSNIHWYSQFPALSGNSNGWKHFEVLLADNRSVFDIELGDTLLYRISFFSDSIFDDLDGIAFDNLCFYEFVEGISETRFTPVKSIIYPNPATQNFTIDFENPDCASYELAVYNIKSELQFIIKNITSERIEVNSSRLLPDVYAYKLTNIADKKRSWGKFLIVE